MTKRLFGAVALLIGTIIGAGIFGIPYVISRAGFFPGIIYLICLGIFALLVTLSYGEVVLRTKSEHQMTGYAEKYLGKTGKKILTVTLIFSIYGALLAYMIGVGDFLNTIFSDLIGGAPFLYSIIFFLFGALAIYAGLKTIASTERVILIVVVLVVLAIFAFGVMRIDIGNYLNINPALLFLPYGVILFAFTGATAVVDMRRYLRGEEKSLKKGIILGHLIPFIIYLIFVVLVVGVSGANTSQEAIRGLGPFLGSKILILGSILGILAMSTSFMNLGLVLREILQIDYKMTKISAWLTAISVPFFIFLLGLTDFIKVIGIAGSVVGGVDGIIILIMNRRAKKMGDRQPEYSLNIPKTVYYLLFLVFGLGILYEVYFTIFGKL